MKKLVLLLSCLLTFAPVATKAAPDQDSQGEKRKEKKRPSDIVSPDKGGKDKGNRGGGGRNRDGGNRGNDGGKSDKPKKPKPDDD
jgi:hypothetical protein